MSGGRVLLPASRSGDGSGNTNAGVARRPRHEVSPKWWGGRCLGHSCGHARERCAGVCTHEWYMCAHGVCSGCNARLSTGGTGTCTVSAQAWALRCPLHPAWGIGVFYTSCLCSETVSKQPKITSMVVQ